MSTEKWCEDYNKLSQCWRIDIGNVRNTLERRQTNQQGTAIWRMYVAKQIFKRNWRLSKYFSDEANYYCIFNMQSSIMTSVFKLEVNEFLTAGRQNWAGSKQVLDTSFPFRKKLASVYFLHVKLNIKFFHQWTDLTGLFQNISYIDCFGLETMKSRKIQKLSKQ